MQPRSFEERLTMLERQMQEMCDLPERVTNLESQILQFRQEVRDEFSATRAELRADIAAVAGSLGEAVSESNRSLRQAIAETNAQMRMLHEETIARIAMIGEGRTTGGDDANRKDR